MNLPWHPLIVHFPIALAVLVPLLGLAVWGLMRRGRFPASTWWLVLALQVLTTGVGYLAIESGEWEETTVEKVTGPVPVERHEEHAEMFVAVSVAASALTVAGAFLPAPARVWVQLGAIALMAADAGLALRTGRSGGELVYAHGAPAAYRLAQEVSGSDGLLPTPGLNTSESAHPVDDGEEDGPAEEDEAEDEAKVED